MQSMWNLSGNILTLNEKEPSTHMSNTHFDMNLRFCNFVLLNSCILLRCRLSHNGN